jgi:hypothetical protein
MEKPIEHNWQLVYEDDDQLQYIDLDNIYYEKDSINYAYVWRRSIFLETRDDYNAFDAYCHIDWGNYTQKSIKFIFYKDIDCKIIDDKIDDPNSDYEKYEEGTITYDVIKHVQKHQVLKFIRTGELKKD